MCIYIYIYIYIKGNYPSERNIVTRSFDCTTDPDLRYSHHHHRHDHRHLIIIIIIIIIITIIIIGDLLSRCDAGVL